jgi:hypothetical protein
MSFSPHLLGGLLPAAGACRLRLPLDGGDHAGRDAQRLPREALRQGRRMHSVSALRLENMIGTLTRDRVVCFRVLQSKNLRDNLVLVHIRL